MVRSIFFKLIAAAVLSLALPACNDPRPDTAATDPSEWQTFIVKGVIREIHPDGRTAVVRHEEIPDFMPAMTMPIPVKDAKELEGLKEGDAISFRLIYTGEEGWMDQVSKLQTPPEETPARFATKTVGQVEDLGPGDLLPDYELVNQNGEAVSLHQFHGNALAMTFIFTSCPMADICPRMSSNFAAAQEQLLGRDEMPENWHFVSITIDPEVDTPERLRAYGQLYNVDPNRWSFLTGDLVVITELAEKLTLYFWPDEEFRLSHNLQTIVVNPDGRIRTFLPGNDWTPEELVEEILLAAKPQTE